MASCPKCQKHLGLKDWRQNCPNCGANVLLHDFEGRFYSDAKRSELSIASTRVLWQGIKAGLVGNKYTKIRLGLMFLPLITLFLPAVLLQIKLPLAEQSWSAGLVGLISLLTKGEALNFLKAEVSSPLFGETFTLFAILLALVALSALIAVLIILLSIFSVFKIKGFSLANLVMCCLGIGLMLAAFVVSIIFALSGQTSSFISSTMTAAPLLCIFAFSAVAFINGRLYRHGVPIVYAQGDEERAAIYKRLKKGKINLDELPFPVVETAETREREAMIREKIAKSSPTEAVPEVKAYETK